MRRVARGWLIACSAMLLSGCLVNSVERFDDGPPSRLSKGRAYVLVAMAGADGGASAAVDCVAASTMALKRKRFPMATASVV